MSYLTEAFKALDALNEETFSVSDDGIKKLAEFETDDDLFDEITVFDADADDTEDLEDSYVGKVIVDCNVCHSKIYKDKSDVVIDEETQNANIDEECPYCYSTDGFKVIGEVAPMTTETEEKVEVEDDLDESKSINEGTFSRVANKIRRATLDEHDPNNRKLYNFIDKFKKEFGIKSEIHNTGYSYLPDGDTEVRNYRMYLECDPEITKQFFIDGKAYKGLKPEYANRFTMNGASNYKANYEMSNGEIQVEIGPNTIYFDLNVVMDSVKAKRDRAKSAKRFDKAYKNESKSINEDLSSITSLADDCGKNTFKKSARDVRFTFEDEKSASKFMNKLKEKNIHYDELPKGIIKVSKASVLDESLNEASTDRVQKLLSIIDNSFEVLEDAPINEDVLEEAKQIRLSSIPGVTRDPSNDFADDGNRFQAYLYKGVVPITYLRAGEDVYITIAFHHLEDINYDEYKEFPSYKNADEFNGVPVDTFNAEIFQKNLEDAYKDIVDFRGSVEDVNSAQLEDRITSINNACKEYEEKVKQYIQDNALKIMKLSDSQFRNLKNYVSNAGSRTADYIRNASSSSQRHFMSQDLESLKRQISRSWNFEYIEDILNTVQESLKESVDLLTREDTIASVLSRHMDELSEYTDATSMRNAIINILDKSEIADKDAVKKLKQVLFSKKSTAALLSTIATYMTGEKVAKVGKPIKEDITEKTIDELEDFINETKRRFPGSEAIYDGDTNTIKITLDEKTINEDLGTDIDEYQQWVDYDMKRYGKISDQTNKEIKEAGLQVVKDKYGDYQVIAGKYDESLEESVNSDIVSMIKKQFPKATIKTSVRKHSDVHKSNPDTPVGKTKYVDIRITPDETSSVNAILQYCNHNIKKVLDSDDRFDYYGDAPARNPRGGKEVLLSYYDYSDLSDAEYSSLLGESLEESVKDITITTDDSKTTMTSEDDGKVTVTTEPVEKHQDDEVIEPLTDETEAEIVANDGEEDIDIEDFDEESFDELGEGYFKKVYENVNSFKTSNVSTKDNKVIVEGIVTFDNNIKKSTKFIFESFSKKNDKYRMIGENVNITKGNKAFSLMGSIKDKKFLSESLNYNYRTKNNIGKSTRCLGTVRRG